MVRTRIAPSPTGDLHIGHIRTLLYNWAYAKKQKGEFMVRIEDTDRERYVEGAVERTLATIKDYGFDWDGEITVQSERLAIYKEYSEKLINMGKAYKCFCDKKRLEQMRDEQRKQHVPSTKYDRHCRNLEKEEIDRNLGENKPFVVRLKVPDDKIIKFTDLTYGNIEIPSNDVDDQVLLKSDGFPTYHFAVVVDDHLMEITHVMRGNDWLPSTPKHVLLYNAFGWELPTYIHLPNLKDTQGTKKLSKRHGAVTAREFLKEGYLPEAVLNFLMLLGWKPGTDQEFYTLSEFVQKFDIKNINRTDLIAFDRNKLRWMNGEYILKMDENKLADKLIEFFENKYDKETVLKILPIAKERISTLAEFESLCDYFWKEPQDIDQSLFTDNYKSHIKSALQAIKNLNKFELDDLNGALIKEIEKNDYKIGKFFMDLRIAITGSKVSPPINESLIILGKDNVTLRLQKVLE